MKPWLIFNPTARGEKAARFHSHLRGQDCELHPTTGPGAARTLASEAVRAGSELVIAAGGDGTVNEVLNGIGDVPGGLERTRLAVIPLGTINVLARELQIPMRMEAAWDRALRGKARWIDVPFVAWQRHGATERRLFAQLAGAGLDSRAIARVNWNLKKKLGPLAYIYAGIQSMAEKQPSLRVRSGDRQSEGELVLVGNGRFYGGKFLLFPNARLDDGLLDVCVFKKVNWLTLMRTGIRLLTTGLHPTPNVDYFQASRFEIHSADEVLVELEGDNAGVLPAQFGIDSKIQIVT